MAGTGSTPPDSQVVVAAGILSDEVYHLANDPVVPPSGWTFITNSYDASSGFYGEAWGQINPAGGYTRALSYRRDSTGGILKAAGT